MNGYKDVAEAKLAEYEKKFYESVDEAYVILGKIQFTPGNENMLHTFMVAAQNIEYWHTRAAGIKSLLDELAGA